MTKCVKMTKCMGVFMQRYFLAESFLFNKTGMRAVSTFSFNSLQEKKISVFPEMSNYKRSNFALFFHMCSYIFAGPSPSLSSVTVQTWDMVYLQLRSLWQTFAVCDLSHAEVIHRSVGCFYMLLMECHYHLCHGQRHEVTVYFTDQRE